MDASTTEPQTQASPPEKPAATRPRKRSTAKKTRQKNRKGGATSEPESAPLPKTTPATLQNRAGGKTGAGPAADPSPPVVKKKAPQPPRQGTRASARLKGKNPSAIQDPAPIKPENKQARRKREADNEEKAVELPKKKTKRPEDQTDTPAQADAATPSGGQPADLASSENVTADRPKEPSDAEADEGAVADSLEEPSDVEDDEDEDEDGEGEGEGEGEDGNPFENEGELVPVPRPRFYLREDNHLGFVISLGYPPSF